jgi:serine/threonine protein kinase
MVIVKNKVGEGGQAAVGTVLWRGGIFARKVFTLKAEFYTELEVVRHVSHPHIVYTFGLSISTDENIQQHGEEQHSLLMELLDGDLYCLIRDRVRLGGRSRPPFSRRDSVHILLQIAKAMAYIHDLAEPVIHGDLKSENILVSKCGILGDVCQYFVKVADFGSAKLLNPSSPFRASGGTTKYAAPEVLRARSEGDLAISCPQKLDVYSFGIVAFEVLTGLEPYKKSPSVLVSKEGVAGLVPYEIGISG